MVETQITLTARRMILHAAGEVAENYALVDKIVALLHLGMIPGRGDLREFLSESRI